MKTEEEINLMLLEQKMFKEEWEDAYKNCPWHSLSQDLIDYYHRVNININMLEWILEIQ